MKKLQRAEKLKLIQSHPFSPGETRPGEKKAEGGGEANMEREILLLGDPRLYQVSQEVREEELEQLRPMAELSLLRGLSFWPCSSSMV